MNVTFTIPGPPQGKGRPRIGKVGAHARMFTPAKTVAYESMISVIAQTAMAGRPLLEGPVRLSLLLHCQIPASWSQKKQRLALEGGVYPTTKPDADNVLKAVCDGCNGVLWKDDVQAVDIVLTKRYAALPCVQVRVQPVEVAAQQEMAA